MKTVYEMEDIKAVASTVVENITPLLKHNCNTLGEDDIFDVGGLAQYLRVNKSWFNKKVSLKEIPYFKCGKYTRFKKSAIDRWVEKETVKPIPPLKMVEKRR